MSTQESPREVPSEPESKNNETPPFDPATACANFALFLNELRAALNNARHKWEYQNVEDWLDWALDNSPGWEQTGEFDNIDFSEKAPEPEPSSESDDDEDEDEGEEEVKSKYIDHEAEHAGDEEEEEEEEQEEDTMVAMTQRTPGARAAQGRAPYDLSETTDESGVQSKRERERTAFENHFRVRPDPADALAKKLTVQATPPTAKHQSGSSLKSAGTKRKSPDTPRSGGKGSLRERAQQVQEKQKNVLTIIDMFSRAKPVPAVPPN
eukprot:304484-Rhodomonas_salina.2